MCLADLTWISEHTLPVSLKRQSRRPPRARVRFGIAVTPTASNSPMAVWIIGARLAVLSDSMLISVRRLAPGRR
jgi:hypothetical protein